MDLNSLNLLVTCPRGFEDLLAREIARIGVTNATASSGGAIGKSDFATAMKTCLWSRIANKVEILLGESYVRNEADVYDLGRKIPIEPWFTPTTTFCVHAHVNDKNFTNSVFVSLKLKDGLVDHMRELWHQRASVDTQRPDVTLNLQIVQHKARVFLEMQGEPLSMRGYRRRQTQAPIRESLAAAMVELSGWTEDRQFVDPMCGSGTIAIEAALAATRTAPGIQRHFAFEQLSFFPEYATAWKGMREEARQTRRVRDLHILAMDIDDGALEIAQNNAQTAGVADCIEFRRGDVLNIRANSADIVTNPPYGERISVSGLPLPEFYYQMGRKFRELGNSSLTIISTAELLKKNMHMKPEQRVTTFNGPIACEVARYRLGISKDNSL